ncbi:MAG TPA: Ig-like domain-containing protein, partial [Povalibacter sp.]|nr:Ig-like domain-containing protein [Povalibacter sp.]
MTLTSIAVTPGNSSAVAGTTVQFGATGTYSNGTTQSLGTVTWTSSAAGVATINASGLATGTGPGSATITATSGSISGSTGLTMTAPTFTGTAAAGLPLVGNVTVKDSLGATKTVPIGANGSYSVDVWGMTPPLMMRAEGKVGSTSYVMHSATATIGSGGTLNITPLTDLIVDNVAGQLAADYFNNGNFAGLTKDALDAESAALKAKLLPVLQAMKVDTSIDLLRTPFTPLSSALDAALEIIRVSVDPAIHVATITNLVNQISILDDIAVKAAAESNPPVLSGDGTAPAADDLPLIRKAVTDFSDLFKMGLPQPASILALLSQTFMQDDQGRVGFANDIANETDLIGSSFVDISIDAIDYDYNDGATPRAIVGFTIRDKDGVDDDHVGDFAVLRESDGHWRLHGNQRQLDFDGHVHQVRDVRSNCRASGLEFSIQDEDSSNSSIIAYVVVSGPGLPAAGLKYQRQALGGDWRLVNTGANPYWYPMTDSCTTFWGAANIPDSAIAAIPDNAEYVFAAFTSSNVQVPVGLYGTLKTQPLPKRPMTLAELNASTRFPSFTTSTDLATYTGGSLTISGSNADPAHDVWTYLGLTDGQGLLSSIDADVTPAADGTFSKTFTLPSPGSVTDREVRVSTSDDYDRGYMSVADYRGFTVGGTITGLTGTVVLRLNGGNPLTVNGSGPFTFKTTLLNGTNYSVGIAVQPATQVCGPAIANGNGTINNVNVTNVAIVCTNFSIGGSISGL